MDRYDEYPNGNGSCSIIKMEPGEGGRYVLYEDVKEFIGACTFTHECHCGQSHNIKYVGHPCTMHVRAVDTDNS